VELKGERRLGAGRAIAWQALNDTEMLRLCIPGCESFSGTGENRYDVVMNAAIGPVKSRFKGAVELADIDAPNGYTIKFDGSGGAAGFARGQVRVTLADTETAGSTQLAYTANVHVGGKLAQVGSRLIDAAAGALADKFFEAFDQRLRARAQAELEETTVHIDADLSKPMAPASFGFWSLLLAFLKRLFSRR
jgi:carbon monoxide dehydrogenase subunit G